MRILINTFDKVKEFCNIANRFRGEVLIKSSKYIINGKSLMGLFSLDLTNEIIVEAEGLDDDVDEFYDLLKSKGFDAE